VDVLEFVTALKKAVRDGAEQEAEYLASPPSSRPPAHLARFASWVQGLTDADRAELRDLLRYVAEGGLFAALTYLDNLATLTHEGGRFELWFAPENGERILLNDPDGDLLKDLFNNSD